MNDSYPNNKWQPNMAIHKTKVNNKDSKFLPKWKLNKYAIRSGQWNPISTQTVTLKCVQSESVLKIQKVLALPE